MNERSSHITRVTNETRIAIDLNLDGEGLYRINTGIPFFDHMLSGFAKHGFFDLTINAKGDLEIDAHHTIEDIGLALGQVLKQALDNKAGIRRYGAELLPMDEALVRVALDLSGRPCLVYKVTSPSETVGGVNVRLFREFFQALVNTAGMNLHIHMLEGEEVHHVFEAVFKAFGKALDQAVGAEPRAKGVPSTKGVLD